LKKDFFPTIRIILVSLEKITFITQRKTMKPLIKHLFGISLAMAACNGSDSINQDVTTETQKIAGIPARFSAQNTSFAFDLLKKVNENEKSKNVFLSPLSVNVALGMLLNGAENTTAAEIQVANRTEGIALAELNNTYQKMITGLPKVDNQVTVNMANSVWRNNQLSFESAFVSQLQETFGAEVADFDLRQKQTSIARINQWVSNKTQNRIPEIIDDISDNAAVFLINAVYFQGNWTRQFDTKQTYDATFVKNDNTQKSIKMMTRHSKVAVAQGINYAAFQLPYGGGSYQLTVVIPDRDQQMNTFLNNWTFSEWTSLQNRLVEREERIGLPRIQLEYGLSLNDALKALGMKKAFSREAELGKIIRNAPLMVNNVVHKTFLKMDEKGTEAAGATSIEVGVTSVPLRDYICSRPYLIFISEKSSDTVLFAGKIVDP
jgi:serine protease inhibitor